MITKVISGGQTGIDRFGLEIAKELGIETGGFAPPDLLKEHVEKVLRLGLIDNTKQLKLEWI